MTKPIVSFAVSQRSTAERFSDLHTTSRLYAWDSHTLEVLALPMAALGPIGDTKSSIERIVHRHRLRPAKRYVAGIKRGADRAASHTEAGNFAAVPESHQRFTPRSIPDIFAERQPTVMDIAS